MSYQFEPKTEDEVQEEQLCPEGLYPFTILESSEVLSKSKKNEGKPMIKLKLNVHGDDGFDYHVYDYIADWFMAFKFRHFFVATGLQAEYESGQVDASDNAFAGRTGWADVGIQKAKNEFPAKNVIRDFKPQEEKPEAEKPEPKAAAKPAPKTATEEDDVPF